MFSARGGGRFLDELGGPFRGWQRRLYLLLGDQREGSCRGRTHMERH